METVSFSAMAISGLKATVTTVNLSSILPEPPIGVDFYSSFNSSGTES